MLLKIISANKIIFEGEIKEVTLPTEEGIITILPDHMPMIGIVNPGIISFIPTKKPENNDLIFWDQKIQITVGKGVLYVDKNIIKILVSLASTKPVNKKDLEKQKEELQKSIELLKMKGNIEELEKKLIELEKINADIKFSKFMK